ncbi:MAG: DNA internalization-related competence protein ComEC/Rec2, partial [Deltaproteobacteria bacterium]|nr:DNA internalization-related competence protein ComEC/Rec2 [Deltaproteobacteria bacterium]
MTKILRLPLIPILIAYAVGLFGGYFTLFYLSQGLFLLLFLLVLWILLILLKKVQWASWVTLAFFLVLGFVSIQCYFHPNHPPSHISRFIGPEQVFLEGTIDRSPQRTSSGTQFLIKSNKIISKDHHIPVEGYLLLFMKGKSDSLRLGDRIRFLCRLQRPHGFHNPGVFSYERYLAFERIHAIGFLSDEKMFAKVGEGFKNPILLRIEAWRDHIRHFLQREGTMPSSALFQALVLGEQGNIPEEVREDFVISGIAHLLAISGDHLGIVAFLSFSLFLWVMKRSEILLLSFSVRKLAAILTIPCMILYTFIAGGGMSVIRATIMVIVFFLSIVFKRERHLLHTLALAALLILLLSPPSLFDVSFQLSFLAVLSILYLVPPILRNLKQGDLPIPAETSWRQKVWRYVRLCLIVTAVATLGTAPFVALHFNRVSLIGFIANLFAIPWVGFIIVPISLIASLFSFIFYPFASLLITLNQFFATLLLKVVAFFASIPFASIYIPTPTPIEIILYYLLFFLCIHLRKGKAIQYLFIGICIFLGADLAYWNLKDAFQKNLRITFLDVGHGDSILVEFPKGKRMLIDGGGLHEDRFDIGKNVIAPFLWKKKIRRIDTLVLTHPDPDHLKGLNFIASRFSIGRFWSSGLRTDSEPFFRLEETLAKRKTERFLLNENTPPEMINGVEITILNPPVGGSGSAGRQNLTFLNNQSLVMRLTFKNITLLLTGDCEKEAEERMMRKGHSLKARLLKIPHHGSSTSS